MIVVECCGKNGPDAAKALNCWRPRRDLNPCYRRERLEPHFLSMTYVAQEVGFGA